MAHARFTYPETPVLTSGELAPAGDPAMAAEMNYQRPAWPLRFEKHGFSARCYDTQSCLIVYDDVHHGDPGLSPPASTYGPRYLDNWTSGHGGIRNFPPPAKVTWQSRDGRSHEADIDIAALFKDQLMRHFVPEGEVKEVPDGKIPVNPDILLEVNDATIRVYMRAYVPTKHLQIPGNPRSTRRDDLVLVETYTY